MPGFVDLHVHGFGGVDFATADAAAYRRAGEAMLATGVTAFQPTFVTAPEEELVASLREVPSGRGRPADPRRTPRGAVPLAAPPRHASGLGAARPGRRPARRLVAAGPVVHMTLAPELEGALDLVDALRARGVVAACGHTDATAEQAHAAFDRGATHVTHLFNAMRPFTHRDPGIAGAALVREEVTVELILDGHHVSDEAALVAWRTARGRVVLVTDGMAADRRRATARGRWGRCRSRCATASSERSTACSRGACSRCARRSATRCGLGIPFEEAVDAATRVPARAARRTDVGRLVRARPQTSSCSTATSR